MSNSTVWRLNSAERCLFRQVEAFGDQEAKLENGFLKENVSDHISSSEYGIGQFTPAPLFLKFKAAQEKSERFFRVCPAGSAPDNLEVSSVQFKCFTVRSSQALNSGKRGKFRGAKSHDDAAFSTAGGRIQALCALFRRNRTALPPGSALFS